MSGAIDWDALRRRTGAALEPDADACGEAARRVLRERAVRLARPLRRVAPERPMLRVLGFALGGEHYAVEAHVVREVRKLQSLTPLPCTPAYVAGICAVRGEILGVIDIGRLFGLPRRSLTEHDRVIVVEHEALRCGLLADAIDGIGEVDPGALGPLPAALAEAGAGILRAVTEAGTALLDAAALLSDARIVVRETVASDRNQSPGTTRRGQDA